MRGKFLGAALSIGAVACAQHGKLALRPLPTTLAQGDRPVSFRVAEAAGQFALGNVALALESYRKALREDPQSIPALLGQAACYDAFGRFDVSRRDYEAALAISPHNEIALTALARSLDAQGRGDEARSTRAELASVGRGTRMDGVTVALPVAVPVVDKSAAPPAASVIRPAATAAGPPPNEGPRLERLSMGEVELVTLPVGLATAPVSLRLASIAPSRAPASAATLPVTIRLLNGARREGLAAATRSWLEQRGWRRMTIGNAPRAALSQVLYPVGREQLGRRLAAQFGIVARPMILGNQKAVVVILGEAHFLKPERSARV